MEGACPLEPLDYAYARKAVRRDIAVVRMRDFHNAVNTTKIFLLESMLNMSIHLVKHTLGNDNA